MLKRTYYLIHPRKFENEYTVGVATTPAARRNYEAAGFRRIERDYALHLMSRQPSDSEQLWASAEIDGEQAASRHETARDIRGTTTAQQAIQAWWQS